MMVTRQKPKQKTESKEELRSRTMRAVRSTDTKPEIAVRKLIHSLGYRYRLHRKDLPGTPDIVFPGRHSVIFVNGCFWHGHECARGSRVPKSNADYWIQKIDKNKNRDQRNSKKLKADNWKVLVIWECEVRHKNLLTEKIIQFLGRS